MRWLPLLGALSLAACGSQAPPVDRAASAGAQDEAPGPARGTTVTVTTVPGTFVWLDPSFDHAFPPPEGSAFMDQQAQMFVPESVLARTGQAVQFRSSDDELHNVRVVRSDQLPIFNVVTPPFGAYTHTFTEPGVYDVTCDRHAAMRATIYVASTPYVGTADERGRFTFHDVLPGVYTLRGFDRGAPIDAVVTVGSEPADFKIR